MYLLQLRILVQGAFEGAYADVPGARRRESRATERQNELEDQDLDEKVGDNE